MRGATLKFDVHSFEYEISTHAPLAGRDWESVGETVGKADFNPRAPCGARRLPTAERLSRRYFNPRAPCGARPGSSVRKQDVHDFNPRAPCGARQASNGLFVASTLFQPTRPLRGATIAGARLVRVIPVFQPTRPLRGATSAASAFFACSSFQPTRPLRGATAKVYKSLCTFLR